MYSPWLFLHSYVLLQVRIFPSFISASTSVFSKCIFSRHMFFNNCVSMIYPWSHVFCVHTNVILLSMHVLNVGKFFCEMHFSTNNRSKVQDTSYHQLQTTFIWFLQNEKNKHVFNPPVNFWDGGVVDKNRFALDRTHYKRIKMLPGWFLFEHTQEKNTFQIRSIDVVPTLDPRAWESVGGTKRPAEDNCRGSGWRCRA